MNLKLHKVERHHYYAMIFTIGFIFGFITGIFFNGQPLTSSIMNGFWYAIIVTIFTIMGYEIGIKKRKK